MGARYPFNSPSCCSICPAIASVSPAAPITDSKFTRMWPSAISCFSPVPGRRAGSAEPAADAAEALPVRVLGRRIVARVRHEAVANAAQRLVELGRVVVPPLLQHLE